ncbi:MAG: MerR family transcriptional regulator [Firmicutes bacterium]|nr:MerR family transcriptional regulator [Bacillota bacterium]
MRQKLYTIGEFSRKSGISPKRLRYYEKIGLLIPEQRDQYSDYRYYSVNQLEDSILINELFMMNLPLDDIKKIITNRQLPKYLEELNKNAVHLSERIRELYQSYVLNTNTIIALNNILMQEPLKTEIVTFPQSRIISTRAQSIMNADILVTERKAQLLTMVKRNKISVSMSHFTVFHCGYRKQFVPSNQELVVGDLELFYLVETISGNIVDDLRSGEFTLKTLPEFRAVSCIHKGPYRSMAKAYDALEAFAAQHNILLEDRSIEEYIIGSSKTKNEEEYITRIYIPQKGALQL